VFSSQNAAIGVSDADGATANAAIAVADIPQQLANAPDCNSDTPRNTPGLISERSINLWHLMPSLRSREIKKVAGIVLLRAPRSS
jgi:hypothetical protein